MSDDQQQQQPTANEHEEIACLKAQLSARDAQVKELQERVADLETQLAAAHAHVSSSFRDPQPHLSAAGSKLIAKKMFEGERDQFLYFSAPNRLRRKQMTRDAAYSGKILSWTGTFSIEERKGEAGGCLYVKHVVTLFETELDSDFGEDEEEDWSRKPKVFFYVVDPEAERNSWTEVE